jgi:hypothetical protein
VIRDEQLGAISQLVEAVDIQEGNKMLNELINSRDLAQHLKLDMQKMFDSNLFASVCSREP